MFSDSPRCLYGASQLAEVICQLRFPEILAIETKPPVEFQEAIRQEYPGFHRREDLLNRPGVPPKATVNYEFSTPDGCWKLNLTAGFFAITSTRYTRWEEFANRLDRPLAAFLQLYQPAFFERIGLRYLNFISRKSLELEGVPYRELISPCYLGPLMEKDVLEQTAFRCSVDTELSLRGGCRAKIHAGPGLISRIGVGDPEVRFVFDQDLYMPGQLPVKYTTGALSTLHLQADSIFRGAITPRLHQAMQPISI